MRSQKNNSGQMRVIETILASFFIIAALSFASIFAVNPVSSGYEAADLEKMAYSALHDLDQQGVLVSLVYNSDWSALRTVLRMTMPVDVYFKMDVYSWNLQGAQLGPKLDNDQIFYGDASTFSDAKIIASVTYSLIGTQTPIANPGNFQVFDPRIVILQLTRG